MQSLESAWDLRTITSVRVLLAKARHMTEARVKGPGARSCTLPLMQGTTKVT